jgi:hypothetical protein
MAKPTIKSLQAEVERLQGLLSGDPKVIEAHFTPGESYIDMQHWAVRLMACSLWKTFETEGGPNFLSMDVHGFGDKGPIEVTIRPKWGTKTPTELLAEAKAELAKLKALTTSKEG